MLRLKSLGQTLIEADDARVTPAAETVFATALYLILAAGRRVDRDELTRLLWPGVSEAQAQHGLRQALYRLKALGATIKADRSGLILAPRFCTTDFAPLFEAQTPASLESLADTIGGSFLPGYRPDLSADFATWVDQQRDIVHSAVARALVAGMQAKKRVSDWSGAEHLASKCLTIDPLNEEATLTVAEAAALGGSKTRALSILNTYLEDIGSNAGEIKLPAMLLRRRISEAYQDNIFPVRDAPFVGREEEMAELTRALARAQGGQGSAYVIWGEPGIGKTRLVSEFTRVASLQRVHIVRVACQSHDVRRPLSAFVDMVPKLLALPGALGCSPESMKYLRRLTARMAPDIPEDLIAARNETVADLDYLRDALIDLMDAVTVERCSILCIDDSQWLDDYSRSIIESVADWAAGHRLLLVSNLTADGLPEGTSKTAGREIVRNLRPLRLEASVKIATHVTANRPGISEASLEWCIRSASGNPLFILELSKHLSDSGSFSEPHSLTRLIDERLSSLSRLSRRLLQVCCILGRHSSIGIIERVLNERRLCLFDSLDELESRGFIDQSNDQICCSHELISLGALRRASAPTRSLLHRHAAEAIECLSPRNLTVLWDCAEHWKEAGENRQAILLLTECARMSQSVGSPLESATALERAAELAFGEERAELACDSSSLYSATGDFSRAEELALLRFESLQSITCAPQRRAEAELIYLNLKTKRNGYPSAVITRIFEIASSADAHLIDRYKATLILMIAADNLQDLVMAKKAFAVFSEIDELTVSPCPQREHCLIVYHSSFGDIASAMPAALRLLEHARKSTDDPDRSIYLQHVGHVFRNAGRVEEAKELYREASEFASSHFLFYRAESAANCLVSIALSEANVSQARHWFDFVQQLSSRSKRESPDEETLSYEAELLIRERDFPKAWKLIQVLEPYAERMASVFAEARILALKAHWKLKASGRLSDEDSRTLESLYPRLARASNQDYFVIQLVSGLISLGRMEDAKSHLNGYLNGDRQPQASLAPELKEMAVRLFES